MRPHKRRAKLGQDAELSTKTAWAVPVRARSSSCLGPLGQSRIHLGLAMWTYLIAALVLGQFGQSATGELRIAVRDAGGLPVACRVTLVSEANDLVQTLDTTSEGQAVAKRLPFGRYRVAVDQPGVTPYDTLVEIDSIVPREHRITLTPASVQAQVTVRAEDTLLDPHQASAVN